MAKQETRLSARGPVARTMLDDLAAVGRLRAIEAAARAVVEAWDGWWMARGGYFDSREPHATELSMVLTGIDALRAALEEGQA